MNMVLTAVTAFAIATASISGVRAADTSTTPAIGAEPQNTSATYGDWILRCSRTGEGDKAVRVCEVALPFQLQGQQGPFAQLAFGRVNPKDPLHITFIMSPNVAFPSDVKMMTDDKDAQPIAPQLEHLHRRRLPRGRGVQGRSAEALEGADRQRTAGFQAEQRTSHAHTGIGARPGRRRWTRWRRAKVSTQSCRPPA